jgi:signal transduction histidine kinase
MSEPKDQLESALVRARAELDEALYELEKLPAVSEHSVQLAAHALNNFLTVTGGTVELLLLALADHPDPHVRTGLEALQQATVLMTHTVSQLMNSSTDRDAKLRFEKVELPVMVRRFCSYYQRIADRKQIRFLSGPEAPVPSVWTDRVATAAVLDNLFSNAVKYSSPGKRIWVEVSADSDGILFGIRDEGPGLSKEDHAKLFEASSKLTPKPTAGEPSSGYGLAVAKAFIERLGGTIWCESALGQGSSFFFRLPRFNDAKSGSTPIVPGSASH